MADQYETTMPSPWMTTAEAADYLKLKASSLRTFRHRGTGPRYHKRNGNVRYHVQQLDAFMRGEDGP